MLFEVRRPENTIVSEGFKGGTRGAPIMPRDVSLSDSKCCNGGQKWVKNWYNFFHQVRPAVFTPEVVSTKNLQLNFSGNIYLFISDTFGMKGFR